MRFKNIPGQEETKKYLASLVDNNRLPHAFLFAGPEGNGKLAMVLAFASYLLCRDRKDGDSCGQCPACLKSDQQIHPDLHFVIPTASVDSKSTSSATVYQPWRELLSRHPYINLSDWAEALGTTKQLNIPKVSIQDLSRIYGLKTYEGAHKVGIIWQAELMDREGNRLLKLIEEPPEQSVFLLVTDQIDRVLSTIVSRCQIVKMPPFRDEDLFKFVGEKYEIPESKAEELIRLANGNIIELIHGFEQKNEELSRDFVNWLRLAYQAKSIELVEWSEEFSRKSKDAQVYFYRYGLVFMEQYLRSFHLGQEFLRLDQETLETIEKMKNLIGSDQALKIVELLDAAIRQLERNANVKLQMINSSLTLHRIITDNQRV